MRVSWSTARAQNLPLPARSVVDGAPAVPVTLVAESVVPLATRRVRLPLAAADGPAFLRHERRILQMRWAFAGVLVVFAAAVLAVSTLPGVGLLPLLVFGVVGLAFNLVWLTVRGGRPAQYPVVALGRVTLRRVDPAAAWEWQTVAGDLVRVDH
ncbi:hypothetical protein AB0K00_28695 [Dactylosporangium sp. NPDC049525]|uniref:hypothetical protein n=1 Tax=Dactylosporangium sp. NPDC049525 TaxID=3154730 RepID=UPI003428E938